MFYTDMVYAYIHFNHAILSTDWYRPIGMRIPIYKKVQSPLNYRPMTLLRSIDKRLTKILCFTS